MTKQKSKIISEKYKKDNCNHWYVKCECICGKILEQRIKRAGGLCHKCKAIFNPPPKNCKKIVGQKFFTRLVVAEYYDEKNNTTYLDIECDCGNKYSTRKSVFLKSKYCLNCKHKYLRIEYRKKYYSNGTTKRCTKCNNIKPIEVFYKDLNRKDGLNRFCKECYNIYTRSKKYCLTEKEIKDMPSQCEICKSIDKLHIDHCHKTGIVRGILCFNCNHGLGNFKDNIELLKKSIEYLEKNNVTQT